MNDGFPYYQFEIKSNLSNPRLGMQGRKEGGEEIQFKCGKGLNYLVGQDTFQIGNQSHWELNLKGILLVNYLLESYISLSVSRQKNH